MKREDERRRASRIGRYQRLLEGPNEDPLGGVANLFDVAMVFVVSLSLALSTALQAPELLLTRDEFTIVENPGKPDMENITRQGQKLNGRRRPMRA